MGDVTARLMLGGFKHNFMWLFVKLAVKLCFDVVISDIQVEVERFPSAAGRRKCIGNCICRKSGCRLLYLS